MKKQLNSFKTVAIPTSKLQKITGGEGDDCGPGKQTPAGTKVFGEGLEGSESRKYSSDCVDSCGTYYTWVPNQGIETNNGVVNTGLTSSNNATIGSLNLIP